MAVAKLSNFASFLSHFAVGTGSSVPDVTDTALDSELARTTTQVTSTVTRTANGVYDLTLEREFDFAVGNGNLTEFGFSYGASSDMLVRELFRDGGGNPITITKTSDYKLRIKYTLTISLLPVSNQTNNIVIAGIGPVAAVVTYRGGTSGSGDLDLFSHVATGAAFTTSTNAATGMKVTASNNMGTSYVAKGSGGANADRASVVNYAAYNNDHQRRIETVSWPTNRANIQWHGVSVGGNVNFGNDAWCFVLDPGDRFTKDSLHTLTLDDILTVSWARA
jgi:hypothetical protein